MGLLLYVIALVLVGASAAGLLVFRSYRHGRGRYTDWS